MAMTTFDEISRVLSDALNEYRTTVSALEWLLINRDLNGRVRLIAPESAKGDATTRSAIEKLAQMLAERLAPHAHTDVGVLYETEEATARGNAPCYLVEDFGNIRLVDRLATEGNWTDIAPETGGARRIVFYSIKGGVGRSTALAATAWRLAQDRKRVLVLDLDLESPGLTTTLLPSDRQPKYGITDWLVEDLVNNGDMIFEAMVASSALAHDGEIYVVPAHGNDPGEYISKLGRVWMPKICDDGSREAWLARLKRLLEKLEHRYKPDVVLLDSRAGIDEIASSCVAGLGANLVLLFAQEGEQTWSGYNVLFKHWSRSGDARDIRTRLQIVGAMIPELDQLTYQEGLRERAYDLFAETLYDNIPAGAYAGELWHFDPADDTAPHAPWAVKWHRSFAALRSLQDRLTAVDRQEVNTYFGPVIEGIERTLGLETRND